jgi:PTS system nitrogen regulatory IIA component
LRLTNRQQAFVCIHTGATMEIKDVLSPADVMVDVRAADKTRLLQELARRAADTLNLSADVVSTAILKREELGSTGMGGGVAIPHARIQDAKKAVGILARLRQAIEFDAIDGQPVDLVFVLLLPAAAENDQLCTLASVARKLRESEVLVQLRDAKNQAELYSAIVA